MAERQTSAVEENQVTSEDVSKWTEDLGEVILVQRARVREGFKKKRKKSVEFSTTWRGEGVKSGDFPQFFFFFF